MPSCIHVFIRGPKKGQVCRAESANDKCYKHRDLIEHQCEGKCEEQKQCTNMTTNVSKRCNRHQFRGEKLLKFKEENDLPLSNVDKIQKVIEILKSDEALLNKAYDILIGMRTDTV